MAIHTSGQQVFEYLEKIKRLEQIFLHNLMNKSQAEFFKVVIASNADSLATWLLPTLKDVLIKNKILLNLIVDDQAHTYVHDPALKTHLVSSLLNSDFVGP